MKKILFLFLFVPFFAWAQPNYNLVLQEIKKGNVQALVQYWDNMVDLTIGHTDYSNDAKHIQSLVDDFLTKNKPTHCSVVHTGAARDNTSFYVIGKLIAGGKNYRMYILFKERNSKYVIQELRFENA